jgi:hypothetical protein
MNPARETDVDLESSEAEGLFGTHRPQENLRKLLTLPHPKWTNFYI